MEKVILWGILLFCTIQTSYAQVEINFPEKDQADLERIRSNDAVDLNGLWEGEVSQLNWLGRPEFEGVTGKLHVEIKQKGSKISGLIVCRAKFAGDNGYLSYEKTFTGQWDGNVLYYEDVKVQNYINTNKQIRHLETCLKKANLQFYKIGNHYHLEGDWQGVGHLSEVSCTPGKIHLTKVLEEDIVSEEALTFNVNFSNLPKGPVDIRWDRKNKIRKLRNRKVEPGSVVKVDSNCLRITVYDHQKDDGDIISLNFNGQWILERFELDNEDHNIDICLEADTNYPNYLVLYAHNLGDVPPNTVALKVNDGYRSKRFVLNSDMNTCDVLYFEVND